MPRTSGASELEWGVALTIPFDWIGPRGAEMRAARSEADASRLDAITARREVLGRLAKLFWEIAHDQQLLQTLRETEAQVARLAGLIRLRVEKGESRPTELPRIETELERVRLDLERALADLRADRAALEAVLGLPGGAVAVVEADGAMPTEPLSREEATARVTQAHPRLAAALARVRAREAVVAAERARRIPGFSLGGYFDRELDKNSAGGVLQVRLPIWNWNTGAIRRAEAEQAAEERAAESAARDLLAEAGGTWERCVQGRGAAARFKDEILPRAEAAAHAVERGYELGEVSLIDVLDARRVLLDARKERIEAGLRARAECTALAVLTGEIDDAK
jgi:cobalt-zinc-cadmium efflux system outer membrane protein